MNSFEFIEFSIENSIATITLNRTDAGNAFNLQMAQELNRAATACYYNESVRAVILNANGKLFSAGGDLASMAAAGDNADVMLNGIAEQCHAAYSTLSRMRAPVIAAINGPAAGIGFSLSVIADITLASDKASFLMAYTAAGLSPDGGISFLLPKIIGIKRAKELALTNRKLSAQQALDWGLINEVVPADELQAQALKLATTLSQGATQALGSVKSLFSSAHNESLEGQMTLEAAAITKNVKSRDGQEGIQAFLERRQPNFTGE